MMRFFSVATVAVAASLSASVAHAALVTVSFTASLDFRFTEQLGSNGLPEPVFDSAFVPITYDGTITFDSAVTSSDSIENAATNVFSSRTFFGAPTFTLTPALESELSFHPDTDSPQLSIDTSNVRWQKDFTGALVFNSFGLTDAGRDFTNLTGGMVESFHRLVSVSGTFNTNETPQEAATPVTTAEYIALFNDKISSGEQLSYGFSESHYICDNAVPSSASVCTVVEGVAYGGNLLLTGVTTAVPIPAGMWLFFSAIAAMAGIRLKRS